MDIDSSPPHPQPTSSSSSTTSGGAASSSPPSPPPSIIKIHPLAIIGISDHHTRVVMGGSALPRSSPVVGLLFGLSSSSSSGGEFSLSSYIILVSLLILVLLLFLHRSPPPSYSCLPPFASPSFLSHFFIGDNDHDNKRREGGPRHRR